MLTRHGSRSCLHHRHSSSTGPGGELGSPWGSRSDLCALALTLCSGQVEGGSQQITSGPSHLDFNLDQQQHNTTTLSVTSPGACLRTQSIDFTDSVSASKGRKIRPAADISGLLVESAICGVTLNTQNYAWASTLCSTLRNGFSGLSFSLLSS